MASLSMKAFGHNRHGEGELGPHLTLSLGSRPTFLPSDILIRRAIWPQQIWAENWGRLWPFGGGGAGSPCNATSPGPRPTCVPSFILIHPTIWPKYTNVTDRTDRQTGRQTTVR